MDKLVWGNNLDKPGSKYLGINHKIDLSEQTWVLFHNTCETAAM